MEVLHRDVIELKKAVIEAHVPETRTELATLRRDMHSLCGYILHLETTLCGGHASGTHAGYAAGIRSAPVVPYGPSAQSAAGAQSSRDRRPAQLADDDRLSRSRSPGHDPSDVARRINSGRRGEKSRPPQMSSQLPVHHLPITNEEDHFESADAVRLAPNTGSGQPMIMYEPSIISSMDETL